MNLAWVLPFHFSLLKVLYSAPFVAICLLDLQTVSCCAGKVGVLGNFCLHKVLNKMDFANVGYSITLL